jgi:hypothetical protein
MSKAEPLLDVVDEWACDRLVRTALDHPKPGLVVAVAECVISSELARRCLIDEPSARKIAAALVRSATRTMLTHKFAGAH